MPQDGDARTTTESGPPIRGAGQRCAFCQDVLEGGEAQEYRGEPLCAACAELAAAAQRVKKPKSTIAQRAADIDTYSIASNRVLLAGMASLFVLAGALIGAILVYHGTRDTWERDNRAKMLALNTEARALLESGDRVAALAKYEMLFQLVGDRDLQDETLRRVLETADDEKHEIERTLSAQEDRRRKEQDALAQEEARERLEAETAEQRRREEQRQRQEEARRQELARQQEQERREKEARENPITISDIGVKLVDVPVADWDWCTYSWKGTITNRTATAITLTVVLTLYDDEGFVLESDYKYGVVIGAGASVTISGQSQVKLSVFNRAAKYKVSVQ